MTDSRTKAFINLNAVLGTLVQLCEYDGQAKALIQGKSVSVGFRVKNGPMAVLRFADGKCTMDSEVNRCNILLPFSSCEKFNGMVNGTVTPIPVKGFLKLGFLQKEFMKLTEILERYLRPSDAERMDSTFMERGTRLMLHLIAAAVAQVGNEDEIGRVSASYMVDGVIRIAIGGLDTVGIKISRHTLEVIHSNPENNTAYMEFADTVIARGIFDGNINALASIGVGNMRLGGMISQADNLNRLLDRVSLYLA